VPAERKNPERNNENKLREAGSIRSYLIPYGAMEGLHRRSSSSPSAPLAVHAIIPMTQILALSSKLGFDDVYVDLRAEPRRVKFKFPSRLRIECRCLDQPRVDRQVAFVV
jgi:hypothetical protein